MGVKSGVTWTAADIPFRIDRSQPENLSKQMTDGLREAIVSGRFKSGLVLPTILEWSRLLGVSIRVPEAAVAALVREGLVSARKRIGCVVNARQQNVWGGRVLVIVPYGDHVFFHNIMVGRVRARVAAAGYLFTQVTIPKEADGHFNLRQLAYELKARPDFTLLIQTAFEIETLLSKSGVPFGVIGWEECRLPGCVATFRIDCGPAVSAIVAHCGRTNVRRVLQVSKVSDRFFDAVPALREAGIEADEFRTPIPPEYGRAEAVARGAMEAFATRLADEGRGWLPDLFVFTDDYVASGALLSLDRAGIRIPDDVRVVTISNKGLGPVYTMSFTRVENDPDLHGDRVADSVLAFLSGHSMRIRDIVPQYIVGETFPPS